MSDRPAPASTPFAVASATFDETVAVPADLWRAVVGTPPESTPLSGDQAAAFRWSAPGGAGSDGGGTDSDD